MKRILALIIALLLLVPLGAVSLSATEIVAGSGKTMISGDFIAEKTGDNEVKIIGYLGDAEELTIPSELNAKKVTSIATHAFKDNLNVRFLTISEGIEEIEAYAFTHCRALDTVNLPSSLKVVGEGAFYYCPRMQSVAIPSTVESIGKEAFGYGFRKFDTETMSYVYSIHPGFVVYAERGSIGDDYAKENRTKINLEIDQPFYDVFDCALSVPLEWANAKKIYCHLWELGEGGLEISKPGSKESVMRISHGWASFSEYIVNRISVGTVCCVVFSTDTGEQTYPAIFMYPNGSEFYTNGIYAVSDNVKEPALVGEWSYPDDSEPLLRECFGLMDGYKEVEREGYIPPKADEDDEWLQYVPEGVDLFGDVNLDGKVNVRDATEVQKYLAFFEEQHINAKGEKLMNVYLSNNYNIKIATQIQKYSARMETDSFVGRPAVIKVYMTSTEEIEGDITFSYTEEYSDKTGTGKVIKDPTAENRMFWYAPVCMEDYEIFFGGKSMIRGGADFEKDATNGVYNNMLWISSIDYETGFCVILERPLR